jgi:phenylacetate-CoA ligase
MITPSPYTRLVSNVLFPLQERWKGHPTTRVRADLERTQWWSRERIIGLQNERLASLIRHAAEHVPYYRSLFAESGVDPLAIRSAEGLASIRCLTKPLIRANASALRSDHARPLARFNTGGSSGEPLVFYVGKERVTHDVAAKWRATRWWNVDIGDPELVVWGSPVELGAQDLVRTARDFMLRTKLLPAFQMGTDTLDAIVATIRERRPRMLFGYPSAIARIASHAADRSIPLDRLGVRVVFVTAERLYDEQRSIIEHTFGCPVANGYGGRDAGFIAHECPSGGMHITAEDIVVETVDGEGRQVAAGEAGEIVVTHLATRDFPFIRYRTGDVGVLEHGDCPCGRGLPMLREIQGRTSDFLVAADGTVMHGLAVIYVLRELAGIASFRVVQESRELTRVELVPGPGYDPAVRGRIVAGIQARLGRSVEVRVAEMDAIPAERSGKHRYVISKVAA